MIIKNVKGWCKITKRFIYSIATGLFILITLGLFALGPAFYNVNPYQFYLLGAIFLAYFFGVLPALIFALGGTFFANYWFVFPYGEFIFNFHDLQIWALNFLVSFTCIILIEYLQRERYKSKLLLLVANTRYLILLHRDNELMNILKKENNV